MANTTTNDRYWNLTDTGVIVAVGTPVIVRKVVFFPTTAAHTATIQEYLPTGDLAQAIYLKAGASVADPVELDFGPEGRQLNGFKLSQISAGSIDVYLGKD